MTRVLFTSMPMAGHLRPGLPIAARLVADGHEVAWYTGAQYAHLPEKVGAQVFLMSPELDFDDTAVDDRIEGGGRKPGLRTLKRAIMDLFIAPIPAWVAEVDDVIDRFAPDVVVSEHGFTAGAVAAERRGIPRVTSTSRRSASPAWTPHRSAPGCCRRRPRWAGCATAR